MDSGQKPWETFSREEKDRYFGEIKDFNDEAQELNKDITTDKYYDHLKFVLIGILNTNLAQRSLEVNTIVVNSVYKEAAQRLATEWRLNLALHPDFPLREMCVVKSTDVEKVLTSRIAKEKGYIPSLLVRKATFNGG